MAVVNDIATAIKTVVDSVSGMPTSFIRKADVLRTRDTPPIVVIAPQDQTPDEWAALGAGGTDRGSIGIGYGFVVAIYRINPGNISSDTTTNPDILEDLREAINQGTLTGASTVWCVGLRNRPEWEESDFASGGEVSRFYLHVDSAEARNG